MSSRASNERLSIVIDYLLETGETGTLSIAPEDYFDLNEDENISDAQVDSMPIHQEVRQYLPEGIPLRQARVQVRDVAADDLWQVHESYWCAHGDDGISVTVHKVRGGVSVSWKKFIHIRFASGIERVLTLIPGSEFPILDGYLAVENDTLQGTLYPERGGLFQRREST